jgi:hypothetical protein
MRHLSNMIVAIYLILGGCEWFYLGGKTELLPIMGKHAILLRLQDRGWSKYWMQVWSGFATRLGVRISASVMVVCGLALFITASNSKVCLFISLTAFIVVLIFNATVAVGLEGADQMATLVLFVNAIAVLVPTLESLTDLFIMAQLMLSYGVAGIAKLISPDWKTGRALGMIISTRSMGVGAASFFIQNPRVAKLVCSSIITFELAWFALPFSKQFAFALMAGGIIFHFSNAWIMGLNLFPWAFLSAYPLALNAIDRLHR